MENQSDPLKEYLREPTRTTFLEVVNRLTRPTYQASNYFPVRIDFAGDVNGDGREDLVVQDHGRVYVIYNPGFGFSREGVLSGESSVVPGDVDGDAWITPVDLIAIMRLLKTPTAAERQTGPIYENRDGRIDMADVIALFRLLEEKGAAVSCGKIAITQYKR